MNPDRLQLIGGSDIVALRGLSPYRNRGDVYADFFQTHDIPITNPIIWGVTLEPVVEDVFGVPEEYRGAFFRNMYYPFLGGHIDGQNVEVKTFTGERINQFFDENGNPQVPDDVYTQINWYQGLTKDQMPGWEKNWRLLVWLDTSGVREMINPHPLVMGADGDWASPVGDLPDYYAFCKQLILSSGELFEITVEFDEAYYKESFVIALNFHTDHILQEIPPEETPVNAENKALNFEGDVSIEELDLEAEYPPESVENVVSEIVRTYRERKECESKAAYFKELQADGVELLSRLTGNAKKIIFPGGSISNVSTSISTKIDYPALFTDLADRFKVDPAERQKLILSRTTRSVRSASSRVNLKK